MTARLQWERFGSDDRFCLEASYGPWDFSIYHRNAIFRLNVTGWTTGRTFYAEDDARQAAEKQLRELLGMLPVGDEGTRLSLEFVEGAIARMADPGWEVGEDEHVLWDALHDLRDLRSRERILSEEIGVLQAEVSAWRRSSRDKGSRLRGALLLLQGIHDKFTAFCASCHDAGGFCERCREDINEQVMLIGRALSHRDEAKVDPLAAHRVEDDVNAVRTMSVAEFRSIGLLQEVNRRLLHRMGLALAVSLLDDGTEAFSGVIDSRDDPDGFIYANVDVEKAAARCQRVNDMLEAKRKHRIDKFGFDVQPISDMGRAVEEGDQ